MKNILFIILLITIIAVAGCASKLALHKKNSSEVLKKNLPDMCHAPPYLKNLDHLFNITGTQLISVPKRYKPSYLYGQL